jgi:hypothetical protein
MTSIASEPVAADASSLNNCLSKEFLFIVGAPRSGTTWLQAMLAAHPAVCTTVELTLYSFYTAPWIRTWKAECENARQNHWHQGLPAVWNEAEFYAFLREFLERVYSRVLALKPTATHILDKHPGYSAYVEDINTLLPQARFIHVIRDGRDVAASLVAAQRDMNFGADSIAAAALQWKTSLEQARQAGCFENRYLEVRYEDMTRSTPAELTKVLSFSGLDAPPDLVRQLVEDHAFDKMKAALRSPAAGVKENPAHFRKGRVGSWSEDFRAIDRLHFDRVAGDLLRELGYASPNWWVGSRFDALALPLYASLRSLARNLKTRVRRFATES